MLVEIAHSTVSKKVSSINPSNQTRAFSDLLLARFNERLYNRYDHHGHDNKHCHYYNSIDAAIKSLLVTDAMFHETNDLGSLLKEDCNYEGNVTELWWRSSRGGGELRRIISDKEIVDMTPKLRKCNIVHIYVIDKPLEGLTLPLVTYNFVDENEVIDQNNNLFEPSLTTNVERVGKTNMTYASQTPIELPSTRKQLIRRLLFTSRQNGDVSTPTNGRDGSMTPTGKNSAKARFITPGFLCRGRLSGMKKPSYHKSSVGQNPSEQQPINAQKENVHDILQAHSDKEKGCKNFASNEALITGGNLTFTTTAINPSENDSPDNEGGGKDRKVPNIAEIFKATQNRKDGTLNEEDAALYLEASHQKKISDMEASHQRDMGEFLKEIKLLKNVVLSQQHSTATPSSAPYCEI
ncbi:hypothetical protein Cgig2_000127 [Carnegiea gigantea]|uniref:Uncharacterized protein n=1 Tax=Carnegiea gigantea TaxID=171969 RepID=A0A9Q1L127_9CARY|nr:hypothetical protein Cgig2_000127 [Carnegiea gigantea]